MDGEAPQEEMVAPIEPEKPFSLEEYFKVSKRTKRYELQWAIQRGKDTFAAKANAILGEIAKLNEMNFDTTKLSPNDAASNLRYVRAYAHAISKESLYLVKELENLKFNIDYLVTRIAKDIDRNDQRKDTQEDWEKKSQQPDTGTE